MAERPETETESKPQATAKAKSRRRSAPPRPWWRHRRFWQVVIAVELVGALAVSYLAAEDGDAAPISSRGGLSQGADGGT
jgi:hypothetical protein